MSNTRTIGPSGRQSVPSQTPSPTEAQELVKKIASQNGWLPENELQSLPPSAREAIANLKRQLGRTTRTYGHECLRSLSPLY